MLEVLHWLNVYLKDTEWMLSQNTSSCMAHLNQSKSTDKNTQEEKLKLASKWKEARKVRTGVEKDHHTEKKPYLSLVVTGVSQDLEC